MKKLFRLLGLNILSPSYINAATERNVQCMQKALYQRKDWIYFYKHIFIEENTIHVDKGFSDDQELFNTNQVSLSFSAIVGKNGAGKSSVVDMIIRILNNLAAAIIGEGEEFSAAERLHFVSDVYGELAVLIDNRVIIIRSLGQSLILRYYNKYGDKYIHSSTKELLDIKERTNVKKNKPKDYKYLSELFYTIVINYSMYAFNYQDYIREADRQKDYDNNKMGITEDDIWLKGVFHKNDGYQTPIVIHPMRSQGLMNIPRENKLAKERLLSMLFYGNEGNFPFRIINDELKIMAVYLPSLEFKRFTKEKIRQTLDIKKGSMLYQDFDRFYKMILQSWMDWIDMPMPANNDSLEHQYVVYKTIKIIKTYKQYYKIARNLFSKTFSLDLFEKHMETLHNDTSHVTLKLRRCLFNLKFGLYTNGNRPIYPLDIAYEKALTIFNEKANARWNIRLSELLPPPTTDIVFQIVRKEKIKPDNSYSSSDVIPFEGLSSGERQIAYSVSNLMYHLINIDSIRSESISDTRTKESEAILKYRYVNIMLDEVELYFHPDLQRRFLNYVKTAINNIQFKSILGINVLIVTHSPFVISDLPQKNILFLGENEESGETYCANIHDMLNQSFFMEYSIGEIARNELQHIISIYERIKENRNCNTNNNYTQDFNTIKYDLAENKNKYEYIVKTISDEYLRKTISNILNEIYNVVFGRKASLDEEIQKTRKRLEELEQERKQYD